MNISSEISRLLREKGMTQADVCRLAGIPSSLMSNYIKGIKCPTLSSAIRLAGAFGVSLDELAGLPALEHAAPSAAMLYRLLRDYGFDRDECAMIERAHKLPEEKRAALNRNLLSLSNPIKKKG